MPNFVTLHSSSPAHPVFTIPVIRDQIKGGEVYCVTPADTIAVAGELLATRGIGALPVVDGDDLVGVLSERDILKRALLERLDLDRTRVADLMTTGLITATPEDSLDSCLRRMQQRGCRHLPIVRGAELVGFLSIKDLLQMLVNQRAIQIRNLQIYMWGQAVPGGEPQASWRCGTCSHVHTGETAPERCPGCDGIGLGFQLLNPV